MNMRCKSSAGFGKSECKALFIENIMFSFACAGAESTDSVYEFLINKLISFYTFIFMLNLIPFAKTRFPFEWQW